MTLPAALEPPALKPLLDFAAGLDLRAPEAAVAGLEAAFPAAGDFVLSLAAGLRAGVAAGTVCQNGSAPLRWSRLFKAGPESAGLSGDAVLMQGQGPRHRHPRGEIDLCLAEEGTPRFDGHGPGWTVYGPDSQHVPTVTGGSMLILYLLPGGEIEFL